MEKTGSPKVGIPIAIGTERPEEGACFDRTFFALGMEVDTGRVGPSALAAPNALQAYERTARPRFLSTGERPN